MGPRVAFLEVKVGSFEKIKLETLDLIVALVALVAWTASVRVAVEAGGEWCEAKRQRHVLVLLGSGERVSVHGFVWLGVLRPDLDSEVSERWSDWSSELYMKLLKSERRRQTSGDGLGTILPSLA